MPSLDRKPSLNRNWRKSTRSNNNGACVEVRQIGTAVEVRDTKNWGGPVLTFSRAAWLHFVEGVREGAFDYR